MLWKDNMLEELARDLRETAHTDAPDRGQRLCHGE